jgi:hypothetical protein
VPEPLRAAGFPGADRPQVDLPAIGLVTGQPGSVRWPDSQPRSVAARGPVEAPEYPLDVVLVALLTLAVVAGSTWRRQREADL